MPKIVSATIALFFLVLLCASFVGSASAVTSVVAVDLAHGESDKYLSYIMGNVTAVTWKPLTAPLSESALADVNFLLFGQPSKPLTPDELQALKTWFGKGGKAVWAAGDSDYGPGVNSINIVNSILESLGSKLRVDQASVEDPTIPMKAAYRVSGTVDPDPGAEDVKKGITKPVLYHGPAVLAYVKPDGTWESLGKSKPDNVFRIVWTTNTKAKIIENSAPAAKVHAAGDEGRFVLLAVEKTTVAGKTNLVVASGESPYGDYEPTWASMYYGLALDGPKFVGNMVTWVTQQITAAPTAFDPMTIVAVGVVVIAIVALLLVRRRK